MTNGKLKYEDSLTIKQLFTTGVNTISELSSMYKVPYNSIKSIITGKTYGCETLQPRNVKLLVNDVIDLGIQYEGSTDVQQFINEMSIKLGVTKSCIRSIIKGRTWKNI